MQQNMNIHQESFHGRLKLLIHKYVLLSYKSTSKYPSDEKFGLVSQDRRSSVSVILNYVEGFARIKSGVMINFFETSYASLKESIYCRFLAKELNYISSEEYNEALLLKDEIGAMLYSSIDGMKSKK